MKRMLCIVGSMNAGGAETFLMKIYRRLDKSEYQMDFAVAVKEKGYYDDEIKKLGGKIFHITPKSEGIIRNFVAIKTLVKNEKYNYVLRSSQHSLSALELLAAKLGGAKVRIFRSSNSNTTTGSAKGLFLHKLFSFMPYLFSNIRIAPSTEAAEFMFGKDCIKNKKAIILHNGLDLDLYKFDENARNQIRKELSLQNACVIGHVGRFNQQKNHKFLLEVFKSIRSYKSNLKLVLVGTGELEESLRKQAFDLGIEKDVVFTGVRSDVPRLMASFDVFLFPSFYEGMPNTVIEAQTCGLPCILSDRITREAKLTDNVMYVSIDNGVENWVSAFNLIRKKDCVNRKHAYIELKEQGYDIDDVVCQFVATTFQIEGR